MTAPELSPEEAKIVAQFDAAPYPAEVLLSHLQTERDVRKAIDVIRDGAR